MNGLENVKEGDKVVAVTSRFHTFISGSFIVDRVTPTLVISQKYGIYGDQTKVKIATATEVGAERFAATSYYADTDPLVAAIRERRRLQDRCQPES